MARPVLIIFTREPFAGETKTRLIPKLGAVNAAAIAHAFTLDALMKASALNVRRVIAYATNSDDDPPRYFRNLARRFDAELIAQGSGSLGARMKRMLARWSVEGAILIGTDTPSLPLRLLERNIAMLRKYPVVLGPSLDGGYYLVGVRGQLPDIFRGIKWGGARVLTDTVARLENTGTPYALGPSWYDVDRWSDVMLLAAHLRLLESRRRDAATRVRRTATNPSGGGGNPCPATTRVIRQLGLLEPSR